MVCCTGSTRWRKHELPGNDRVLLWMGTIPIAPLSQSLQTFQHGWGVSLLSWMLNWALNGILPRFRHLKQGWYFSLLVWWLMRRDINLRCNPCTLEATIISVFCSMEPHMSSLNMRCKGLYTFLPGHRSQISCGSTCATPLSWIPQICSTTRQFDLMLEVIVAAIVTNLMSVYSEFLVWELCKLVYGQCRKGWNS